MKQKDTTGTITVTLRFEDYMEGTIRDSIESRIVEQLAEKLRPAIDKTIEKQMLELCDAEFKKLAKAKVEELLNKGQRKTNNWGEPFGEPISLRESLLERFSKYLEEKVNANGDPDRYSSEKSTTRVQFLMNQLGRKPLEDAIAETVKGIAAKAKEQIQASVSRYIAEQLTPRIDVPQLNGGTR